VGPRAGLDLCENSCIHQVSIWIEWSREGRAVNWYRFVLGTEWSRVGRAVNWYRFVLGTEWSRVGRAVNWYRFVL
jgi:hypothetical protein